MELKGVRILEINDVFGKIANADVDIKTAICIANNLKVLETPVKILRDKQRDLLDKYGEKDADGNLVEVDNGIRITNMAEFVPQMEEIMGTDIEVDLKKIKLSALENIKISANDIRVLNGIIEDEEDTKTEE